MRIGHITGEYPPMRGGIADYTAILVDKMVERGHQVFVLTHPDAANHVTRATVNASVTNWNQAFWGQVRQWVQANQLDVVNIQYQTAAFNMAGLLHFLPSRLSAPVVTTFHDLRFPYLFPKAGMVRPWIVKQLARRSDAAIVTNRADENGIAGLTEVVRIPLGTTVEIVPTVNQREQIRPQLGIAPDDFVVTHFGFVNASKGVDVLIRAVAILENTHLVMIGERYGSSDPTNIAYTEQIEALAGQLGVKLHWTGFVDAEQMSLYFGAGDVVALPFIDGVSLRRTSLQAALAYGCTVVTTFPSGDPLPEFVDGEHLCYVPPNDVEALAEMLKNLQLNSDMRHQLGLGAVRASQQFDWDTICDQVLAVYHRVT